jgi:4-alpha-glucanotransferase
MALSDTRSHSLKILHVWTATGKHLIIIGYGASAFDTLKMPVLKGLDQRSAGILCHLSSLPGAWANGDLGKASHDFIKWAREAGCHWWQMLPCHPTGGGDSPYQALSAFAGNPLFISVEDLAERGWLKKSDLAPPRPLMDERADFSASFEYRFERLRRALAGFDKKATASDQADFSVFCERERGWLDDWALFAALKRSQGGRHWVEWESGLREGQAPSLAAQRGALEPEIRFEKFAQFVFETQWRHMKAEANRAGLGLIGDMPIFVAHDSSDVWAHPELFELDPLGQPLNVAGVPPDYFSEDGQRWGNPLYRWEIHKATNFRWWVARFARALSLFDAVRVDHFIGFHRYWEIPAASMSAKQGQYLAGPGAAFFELLKKELGGLPIIAEDLGVVTPEVTALRKRFGLAGMRVLHFCFGGEAAQLPESIEPDTVAYTGTHDNNTTRGWLDELAPAHFSAEQRAAFRLERERALAWSQGKDLSPVWSLVAGALETRATLAMLPLQDLLELGGEARMNTPGTADGNWRWRARPGALKGAVAARLRHIIERTARL